MRSVSFTTTVHVREPRNNIVDLDAYRRELTGDAATETEASAPERERSRQSTFRHKLQDLALLLEIFVGFSMLVLIFVTLFRVLF